MTIAKTYLLLRKTLPVILLLTAFTASAQQKVYDSLAISLLDRMSDIIGELNSGEIQMSTTEEKEDSTYGKLTMIKNHTVYFSGDHKFLVTSKGDDNSNGYWFNGDNLFYYSFSHNHYGVINAEGKKSLEMISTVHDKYGVEFPAVDFFYPTFTDDLIEQADHIEFLGPTYIGDRRCYKIAANGAKLSLELWLAADAITLPVKFIIRQKIQPELRYEADFQSWNIGQELPDAIFDFAVPPDATPLIIVPKK